MLFKSAVKLVENKEHLTVDGLNKLVSIRASLNEGLSSELSLNFPNIIPIERPLIINKIIPNPNLLAGFT